MQQGGAPYRALPELPNFGGVESMEQQQQKVGEAAVAVATAEAAPPISSRPPAAAPSRGSFEDLGQASGGFLDEDEPERGVSGGNRWPRQETLALLKLRSDMDAAFRDATLKALLWEDVSRKLGELGYHRSAKKCKEKFENVHKYYKRTKEGRARRQDGKNYRFFSQLEALHAGAPAATAPPTTTTTTAAIPPQAPVSVVQPVRGHGNPMIVSPLSTIQPAPVPGPVPFVVAPVNIQAPPAGPDSTAEAALGMPPRISSFSSNTSSATDSSESDEDMEEEEERGGVRGRKRKRARSDWGGGRMMEFFEGLMKQMMERQEAMQQRFLDAIERREHDRMIREEVWKRQEMARLAREHEMLAQERAMCASRDAAIIAFLQKLTGQTIQLPQLVAIPAAAAAAAPPLQTQSVQPEVPQPPQSRLAPQPQHHQQEQKQLQQLPQSAEALQPVPSSTEIMIVAQPEQQQQPPQHHETCGGLETMLSSSRWPKSEVQALIRIRSGMESRYQEAGPKGPLWDEISAEMQRLGFNRSSKRCKEKWENINKYFKKVKESNKKRPEDAKTCPYFHQLDVLYKQKILGSSGGSSGSSRPEQDLNPQQRGDVLAIMPPPPPPQPQPQPPQEAETKSGNAEGGSSTQVPTSNGGGFPTGYFQEGPVKKPEDIMKELMGPQKTETDDYLEEDEGDEFDDNDNNDTSSCEDDDNHNDERKMAYKIEFQRQNPNSSNGGNQPSSFLAIVQ